VLDVARLRDAFDETFAHTPGLGAAILFGSVARGTDTPVSDLDVAVVGHGVDPYGLAAELARRIGREVDVVEVGDMSPIPLLRAVLRDGVVLYERERGEATRFRVRALTVLDLDGPAYDRMMHKFLQRVAERGVGP
jgi:predicted nucleotidyltransferase